MLLSELNTVAVTLCIPCYVFVLTGCKHRPAASGCLLLLLLLLLLLR